MKISLVGMMGAGKSSIGARLARRLGICQIDSDREITISHQMSIASIFEKYGEGYFREIERELIIDVMSYSQDIVLSTGGGAFMERDTRECLLAKSRVFWLDVPISDLIMRLSNSSNKRPLLQMENFDVVLCDMLKERIPIYRKAHHRIGTVKKKPSGITREIISILNHLSD